MSRPFRLSVLAIPFFLLAHSAAAGDVVDVPVQPVHSVPTPDVAADKPTPLVPAAAPAPASAAPLSTPVSTPVSMPALPHPATASLKPVTRSEDDLVLLTIRADGATLAESVPGYADKGMLLLPLGQIAEAIEFPIKIAAADGTANGWFYRENNLFSLDIARAEVTIDGNRQTYDPALVELHEDDIYVDRALLEKWFLLKIDFSFSSQTVTIAATGGNKLPIEISGELEKRKQALASQVQPETKNYPAVRQPYSVYSIPFSDVSVTSGYDFDQQAQPPGRPDRDQSTGDLLYMNADFFSSYDTSGGDNNWRLTLSRRDPEGELFSSDEAIRQTWLGEAFHEMKVNDFSAGDVYTPELPLTAKNQSGVGAYISNQPFDRATQFDRTTLQGNILPNWDVELYRNDELLSFQRAGADGRYSFVDVPLVSGLNILRLVFHGPFAETREETRRIMVSPDIAKEGQSYFRMGVLEQGQTLSSMAAPLSPVSGGSTGSNLSTSTPNGMRSFLDYEYGLMNNLALFGQLVQTPTSDTGPAQDYATAGVGASLFGVYGRVDGSESSLGGHAVQGLAQTNLWGVSLTGRHQIFDNFLSDYTNTATNPITHFTEARADTPLDVSWLPRFNFSLSGSDTLYKDGQTQDELTQTTSTALARLAVSNSLTMQRIAGGSLTTTTTAPVNSILPLLTSSTTGTSTTSLTSGTTGTATLSLPVWDVNLRGEFGYDLAPEFKPDTVALTADKALSRDTNLRGEISRDMTTTNTTTFLLGFNRTFDVLKLGINGSYDTQQHAAAFVNLTFSFGHSPASDSWHFFGNDTARDGIVTARAFIDKNKTGVFQDGDEPLPNIIIHSDGGASGTTDDNGFAVLTGQRTTAKNNITVDQTSLSNPSWVVQTEGYAAITRAGTPVHIDFAIADSGEIDGTVYLIKSDGSKTVASNVLLQLVGDDGNVSREVRSSFDGYYIFERVKKGHYALRVSPDQLSRRSLKSSDPVEITVKGEETALSGIDFVLSRQ